MRLHFCVIFEEGMQRFENVLFFVDSIRLYKFFIFFDDFTNKRFYRFQATLTTAANIMQIFY
jgi:hypothetical protein